MNTSATNISIAWQHLTYKKNQLGFNLKTTSKTILNQLNGHVHYHTLNGLMGPSGAGKTTLLNCLGSQARSGMAQQSEIYVSGSEQRLDSCYIAQHVHQSIDATLTVRQVLQYAFRFKNKNVVQSEMHKHILGIVDELMLGCDVLDRAFGICSGGEQKRVAIGQELMALHVPTFLLVDEPSTGLDSVSALEVMTALKQLTLRHPMTIIASIHVPNAETLALFNQLYVLAKGGVCIYSGPPAMLGPSLEEDIQMRISADEKPIEVLMQLACHTAEKCSEVAKLSAKYAKENVNQLTKELPTLKLLPNGLPQSRKSFSLSDLYIHLSRQFQLTFISNFAQLSIRHLSCLCIVMFFSLFFTTDMVLPSGCISTNDNATQTLHQVFQTFLLGTNINYLILLLMLEGYLIMCSSSMLFASSSSVFRNEHRNNWYSLSTFFISTNMISILDMIIFSTSMSTMAYFIVSQHAIDQYHVNWNRLGQYILMTLILLFYTHCIGQAIGALMVNQIEMIAILSTVAFTMVMLVNDYLFKTDELQSSWLKLISDVVASKYVTRYMVYIFYGIDRCDSEIEYSWVLREYHIQDDEIVYYIMRPVRNSIFLLFVSFVILFFKYTLKLDFYQFVVKHIVKLLNSMNQDQHPIRLEGSNTTVEIDTNDHSEIANESVSELPSNNTEMYGVLIGWRNLSLYGSSPLFKPKSEQKLILQNLNGQFQFGSVSAVMGASGAGKTSFLNVLCGKIPNCISDQTRFYLSKSVKIRTCFISQNASNHLVPGLTVKQTLLYASMLKNIGFTVDHEAKVMKLLKELNMHDICSNRVDKCSGGEQKRLALALELTSLEMPNLVIFDEPTSGLDSNSAEMVISCLCKLAQTHRLAIVASMHQPTTQILNMLHQVYILARGGVCIYAGSPFQIRAHILHSLPETHDIECKHPLDLLLSYSCKGIHNTNVQKLAQISNQNMETEKNVTLQTTQQISEMPFLNRTRFTLTSTCILAKRYFAFVRTYKWKEWLALLCLYVFYSYALAIFFHPKIAHASGCVNFEDDFASSAIISQLKLIGDNFKYNIFVCCLFLMLVIAQSILSLFLEFDHFVNEHQNGWYSSGSFYLTKAIFEMMPILAILPVYVYICNIYSEVQPGIYWHMVLVLLLAILATQGQAHCYILVSNQNFILSFVIGVGTFFVFLLLSNIILNLAPLHYAFHLLSNFAVTRFAFEALLLLQYGFDRCDENQIQLILYDKSLHDSDYYHALVMLVFNIIFWRGLAVWLLILKANPRENTKPKVGDESK